MNRLKELRKDKAVSQKELADFCKVTEKTVSRWENGESQIKPDKAQQLAEYFGVSVGYLLGYDESINGDIGIDDKLKAFHKNIRANRKASGHVFSEEAFQNAAKAWKAVPYLDLDQYAFELILNSNTNNIRQIIDKETLIEHFKISIENLSIGQNDDRVPREVKEYLAVLSKQYEKYLLDIK